MRYNVHVRFVENGALVDRTLSVEAPGRGHARKAVLDVYGDVVIVTIGPERFLEHRQRRYAWSEERLSDGTYAAVMFSPVGPGARSGTATRWKPTREARFATRKAAIRCAQKWYEEAKAGDARADADDEQRTRGTTQPQGASVDLDPSFGACKNCGGQLHVARDEGGERFLVCSGEDDGGLRPSSMQARLTHGCGQVFPLPQRGTLRTTGKTCTCGWPLIQIVTPYLDSTPWVQCVDVECRKLRDKWRASRFRLD